MFRRWLIRGLALALLMLGLVAWVGSYARAIVIHDVGRTWIRMSVSAGRMGFRQGDTAIALSPGWHADVFRSDIDRWMDFDTMAQHHAFGFATYRNTTYKTIDRAMTVPIWFPTLLSALLLWLLWRRTKPIPKAQGFPIEPTAKQNDL